jgi:hypothetical protein
MLKKIYNSKWFPRLFYVKPDGGKDSGVTAYFLIEWKVLFSIGLLRFKKEPLKRLYPKFVEPEPIKPLTHEQLKELGIK